MIRKTYTASIENEPPDSVIMEYIAYRFPELLYDPQDQRLKLVTFFSECSSIYFSEAEYVIYL
jgi:hypothetical protein